MKIAIIPARGGSKRIPKKNIKSFCEKPIISYSIRTAIDCELFDRVIVSTDDKEIAMLSKSFGAEVPFSRPKEISDDYATTSQVIQHALGEIEKEEAVVKYVCCIYATAPFIRKSDLKKGHELLKSSNKSYVFTVGHSPFALERALYINSLGEINPHLKEFQNKRTQDLEQAYYDAGQFYWGKVSSFREKEPIYSTRSLPIIIPRHLVHDIDTEEDWLYAEMVYRAINADKREM